ncbi:related to STAM-binding protein [Rhynchosporium secalis]|uniref:Related to STAM-binding protein n=1 Tax=Rhynchosporium secalis TaxID=38038 RepID=A0A1E1MSU9_RHYSE|nr:related to STAM-binding protein [Rhynchosporium secalis]
MVKADRRPTCYRQTRYGWRSGNGNAGRGDLDRRSGTDIIPLPRFCLHTPPLGTQTAPSGFRSDEAQTTKHDHRQGPLTLIFPPPRDRIPDRNSVLVQQFDFEISAVDGRLQISPAAETKRGGAAVMAGSSFQVSKPMNVKEIVAKAQDFEFSPYIAMKVWLRSADTLLREAQIYQEEGNDQQAYLLLMRYATLVTEKLPLHPAARSPENREGMKATAKQIPIVIHNLEVLKPRINARYAAWEKNMERRREVSVFAGHERSRSDVAAASDPAVAGNTTTLAAADHSQLAVKLAHKEIKRRDAARRATRQAGVSEQEEQERRTAGLWDDWESALSKDRFKEEDEMRRTMESTRRRMDGAHDGQDTSRRQSSLRSTPIVPLGSGNSEYRYPSVAKSQPLEYDNNFDSRSSLPKIPNLPPKPPKQSASSELYELQPPPLPSKSILDPPPVDMAKANPNLNFTFRPSAYLESGEPLRTVFLPPTLRNEFLRHAEPNTRNNLETCGMLCGTLISNALFIQRVVIPEQKSTSDTCETVNESTLFDYVTSEDMMLLGWIHTHPTQSCFMSSVDLHTHFGYQTMFKESIAIVCAPSKNPSWGVFRLTDPPGKQAIAQCKQSSLFHPHAETNIYTDALRPGHVFEAEGLEYSIVDLRT